MDKEMLESLLLAKELGGNSRRTNLCLGHIVQLNLTLDQLRSDLARAEGEREKTQEDLAKVLNAAALWMGRANTFEQERDTLKAELLAQKAKTLGWQRAHAKKATLSARVINALEDKLTQAEEAHKLCAVQMMALEEERGRLVGEVGQLKQGMRQMKDAEIARWKNSYENMRDFAVKSGLDIVCDPHGSAESSTLPRTTNKENTMDVIDRKFQIKATNPVNGKTYDETNSLLLCAKDKAVPAALFAYKQECERIGANLEHIRSVELLYNRVKDYQAAVECRVPDTVGAEIPRCIDGEGVGQTTLPPTYEQGWKI